MPGTSSIVRVALRLSLNAKKLAQPIVRTRLDAIVEGDLGEDADAAALTRYDTTVNFGLAVQAATGSSHAQLRRVVDAVLRTWPP